MRHNTNLEVYIAGYNMGRELENTLFSISKRYQRKHRLNLKVHVIDNGSDPPMSFQNKLLDLHVHYINNAKKSPMTAMNTVIASGSSEYICVILDGARMWSPGVLQQFERSISRSKNTPCSATAYHLGPSHQSNAHLHGYSKEVEIRLLRKIDWKRDGYRLFCISVFAGANPEGEKGMMNESCCLFLKRSIWEKIGGFNEQFQSSGGGFGTLDLFSRLMDETSNKINVLGGEGCFHQIHGGISTSPSPPFDQWQDEFRAINGHDYNKPIVFPRIIKAKFIRRVKNSVKSIRRRDSKHTKNSSYDFEKERK